MNSSFNIYVFLLFLCFIVCSCTTSKPEQKIEYHANGNVKGIGLVKGTEKVGVWAYYDEHAIQVDSIPYINGVKMGEIRSYDLRTGELAGKGFYIENLKQGVWQTYHEGGAVHGEEKYRDDVAIDERIYFFANGNVKMKTMIQNGKSHGDHKEYYVDGAISVSGYYHNGKIDGEWKEYSENGLTKEIYNCQSGLWHGKYQKYHDNGNIAEQGRYDLDQKTGTWEYFDKNGVVIATQTY